MLFGVLYNRILESRAANSLLIAVKYHLHFDLLHFQQVILMFRTDLSETHLSRDE